VPHSSRIRHQGRAFLHLARFLLLYLPLRASERASERTSASASPLPLSLLLSLSSPLPFLLFISFRVSSIPRAMVLGLAAISRLFSASPSLRLSLCPACVSQEPIPGTMRDFTSRSFPSDTDAATIQKFSGRGWSAPTISISLVARARARARARERERKNGSKYRHVIASRNRCQGISASHPIGLDCTFVINANPIPRRYAWRIESITALIIRSDVNRVRAATSGWIIIYKYARLPRINRPVIYELTIPCRKGVVRSRDFLHQRHGQDVESRRRREYDRRAYRLPSADMRTGSGLEAGKFVNDAD